ncbi:MAG: Crp/Fnr family transcriptional regulator [Gammaproteobacteria bacterium]
MKTFLEFSNRSTYLFNIVLLVLLALWALLGVWGVLNYGDLLYWKIGVSLAAVLIFSVLFSYVVVQLYRQNLKLIDIFRESSYACDYQPGEYVFREGDNEKIMYLVLKGEVEIASAGKVFEIVAAGGLFGEMSIIENLPRSASARCISSAKLVAINEQRFYSLIQEIPFFAKEVMKAMSQRLRNTSTAKA